jgi:hypothetical protein
MLVDSHIRCISGDESAKLATATVAIVTKKTDLPELVGLVKRSVDIQYIDGQLLDVKFLL